MTDRPDNAAGFTISVRLAVLVLAVLSMVVGCAGGGVDAPLPATSTGLPSIPPPTVVPGVGSVNMDTATITVPIDAYTMSVHDMNIILAARSVQFDICFFSRDTLQADEIAGARAWLTNVPYSSHWYFGAWDAPFIAKNGWPGIPQGGPSIGPSDYDPSDLPHALDCGDSDAVGEFTPSSPMYGFGNPDALERYWGEGFEYAALDQRFIDLTNQRNACIVSQGYTVAVDPGNTVAQLQNGADWSAEQILAANIVVAQCADAMSYTQQWVDIVAAYQMSTISQHEAELVAIKQSNDALVAKATDLLKQYGVM